MRDRGSGKGQIQLFAPLAHAEIDRDTDQTDVIDVVASLRRDAIETRGEWVFDQNAGELGQRKWQAGDRAQAALLLKQPWAMIVIKIVSKSNTRSATATTRDQI